MRLLLLLLLTAACATTTPVATAPATLLAVRHAEAASGDDPGLSDAGAARAQALVTAARNAGVQAIYVTQYRRTKETAQPIATALGVPVIEVPADRARISEYGNELVRRINAERPGQTVLVVGHSNTTPMVVKAATGVDVEPIAHETYDRLYVVSGTRVIVARY